MQSIYMYKWYRCFFFFHFVCAPGGVPIYRKLDGPPMFDPL